MRPEAFVFRFRDDLADDSSSDAVQLTLVSGTLVSGDFVAVDWRRAHFRTLMTREIDCRRVRKRPTGVSRAR